MSRIRIMLVDDHEVVRLGLRAVIERHSNFDIVAEASSETDAVEQALEHKPDIILMDIRLSGGSGVAATEQIVTHIPDTKIIMLTSYADDEMLFSAIRAGAIGYVLKQVNSADLLRAIEATVRGESHLDPSLTQRVFV